MRILHTSDWHLGRSFHGVGMLDAQQAFLDHLVEVVSEHQIDLVLVSGDVYDRAIPSVDVVTLLDEGLTRLVEAGTQVILTGGNHDSARRLGFGSRLLEAAKVHIRADPSRVGEPVLLQDAHGPVAVYPLPYLEPAICAKDLGAPSSHAGVLGAALEQVRADLGRRPSGTRSVVAAHTFVVGGQGSDSERDIAVGGVASVSLELFSGFDYVALGHLHGRQRLSESVRYSGSPLAYSFSEHTHVKGTYLVTLDGDGLASVEPIEAPVPRPLAVIRGNLEELLWRGDLAAHEQSWCQVTLTDPHRPARAMERVRARFPHTVELRFEPVDDLDRVVRTDQAYTERLRGRSELEICIDFLEHVRRRPADERESGWLAQALTATRLEDLEATGVAVLRDESRKARRAATTLGAADSEPAAERAAGRGW